MTQQNATHMPPMRSSDEANQSQLQLAREQGLAFERAVKYMTQQEAHGDEIAAGDYRIGYAVEEAEGMYTVQDGRLVWQEPQAENAHVEVVVCDRADGRFIPGLTVYATLLDAHGQEIGTHQQPFLWHPWLYHYGRNWQVPGAGEYTLHIRVEPPQFPRHDKTNGQRYTQPVTATFSGVRIQPGQKRS